jgi:MFS family permease
VVRPPTVSNAAGLLLAAAAIDVVATMLALLLPDGSLSDHPSDLRSSIPHGELALSSAIALAISITLEVLFAGALVAAGLLIRNGRGWVRVLVIALAVFEARIVFSTGSDQPLSMTFTVVAAVLAFLRPSTRFIRTVREHRRAGDPVLIISYNDRQGNGWASRFTKAVNRRRFGGG